jgi:DNA-binding beta-propeller fold protein YncE
MKFRICIMAWFFTGTLLVQGATDYKIVGRYPVPGTGGFDYVLMDSGTRGVFVSHGTQVDVVDADSGKIVGSITDTPGVHGNALAAPFHHGFTSNGRENKVSMFDSSTLQLIKKIEVGKGSDGIYYDPASKRIFTNNHGSHDISAIDASTGEVVGTVRLEGDGEQAVIGSRVDNAAFDPEEHLVFFSCGDGILNIYRQKAADA